MGYGNFKEDLDLVRMARRMRMYGTGLYYLLGQS